MDVPGISTAEKRKQLADAGEPWPVCECHGAPLDWSKDNNYRKGGRWRCRVGHRRQVKTRRIARQTAGLCVDCGQPADGYRCEPHTVYQREASNVWNHTPRGQLVKSLSDAKRRVRNNPQTATGAGRQAFADWLNRGTV